jgi:hypothetical protein
MPLNLRQSNRRHKMKQNERCRTHRSVHLSLGSTGAPSPTCEAILGAADTPRQQGTSSWATSGGSDETVVKFG